MDHQNSIVISSSFAAEPLRAPLSFWLSRLKLSARLVFAPELQLIQNLLDANSAFHSNAAGLNVVLFRWQDLDASGCSGDRAFTDLSDALRAACTGIPLLVLSCPSSPPAATASPNAVYSRWNKMLAREFAGLSRVSVVTPSQWQDLYPILHPFETGGDEFALVPYTPATYAVLATWIARKFHMSVTAPYKVIAVDCDDTLWDGACGEDGPHGVKLDPPHLEFQQFLRGQVERGCLICLTSKNNPEDVEAVFRQRSEMILRFEDIAATRINWRPKAENLLELAGDLGLSMDSFIFIDDNPIECEMMRKSLREVLTLQLPANQADRRQFLKRVWAFDRLPPTAEDTERVSFYRREREREQLRQDSASLEDFIAGLDLVIEFKSLGQENLDRASQLTFRVNQFNATTIRRTEAELAAFCRGDSRNGWLMDVRDRFGAYGLVGLVLFETRSKSLQVDTFLLSCRALGRGVEHATAVELATHARSLGLERIDFSFIRSDKNQPIKEFFESEFDDYARMQLGAHMEYHVPVESALAVRYRPMRKKDLASVPVDQHFRVQIYGDFDDTRAETLAWIATELTSGDGIQSVIADCTRRESDSREFFPPRTDSERQIAEIWADVLGVAKVGLQDNFFALGGDSLAMIRVILRVHELTGFELPIQAFFDSPTIEQQMLSFPIGTRSES
jgi:FkbH-like protein